MDLVIVAEVNNNMKKLEKVEIGNCIHYPK
jgi:hypothetical protein